MKTLRILTVIMMMISCGTSAQTANSRTEEESRQLADTVYFKLAKGANFSTLVKTYSEDPGSNEKGGRYTNCLFGTFVPEFEAVVMTLKPDEISKPFKTEYGYHIVQLLSKSNDSFSVRQILIRYNK